MNNEFDCENCGNCYWTRVGEYTNTTVTIECKSCGNQRTIKLTGRYND